MSTTPNSNFVTIKPYELFVKFENNGMVFKFKKDTIDECHDVCRDFKTKYPDSTITYEIYKKTCEESGTVEPEGTGSEAAL
jgi:hypothetical protein